MPPSQPIRVLHVSPHPDDELLGAPAALMALADAGHAVTNFAVSLGRPEQVKRRQAELREACSRAGFALEVCATPLSIGSRDDCAGAQVRLTHELVRRGTTQRYDLLVAPSPHDGHHAHELVGRASVAAASALRAPLWLWGLWSDLPLPTILHAFDQPELDRIERALAAYEGEIERNDYRRLLTGRAQATAITGPERVFGFGSPGVAHPYAEVLCEVVARSGVFLLGAPRLLDAAAPFAPPTATNVGPWLQAPSPRVQVGC
jgi:LmbE family N-acetylglucosaminyl deacetylase